MVYPVQSIETRQKQMAIYSVGTFHSYVPMDSSKNKTTPMQDNFTLKNYKSQEN